MTKSLIEKTRINSVPWSYAIIGLLFASLGFVSGFGKKSVNSLRQFQTPDIPADKIFAVNIWEDEQPFLRLAKPNTAVCVTEMTKQGLHGMRFWCARWHDQWGEVNYEFPIENPGSVKLAALVQRETTVFNFLDETAVAEIWINSGNQTARWVRLGRIDASGGKFPEMIDITEWAQRGSPLRVRFRLKATKALYHPTENDPIGFAGAQALRVQLNQDGGDSTPNAIELQLWSGS